MDLPFRVGTLVLENSMCGISRSTRTLATQSLCNVIVKIQEILKEIEMHVIRKNVLSKSKQASLSMLSLQLESVLRKHKDSSQICHFSNKRKGKGKKEEEKPKEEEVEPAQKAAEEVPEKAVWLPPFDPILLDFITEASKTILPLPSTKQQVITLAE